MSFRINFINCSICILISTMAAMLFYLESLQRTYFQEPFVWFSRIFVEGIRATWRFRIINLKIVPFSKMSMWIAVAH